MYSLPGTILLLALVCFMPGLAWSGSPTDAPITTIEVPVVDVQVPQALLAELQPPPQQQTHKQTGDSQKRIASVALDIKCDVNGTSHDVSCY